MNKYLKFYKNEDKGVFVWGKGKMGQLGQGEQTTSLPSPKKLIFPNQIKIVAIQFGPLQSAFITGTFKFPFF